MHQVLILAALLAGTATAPPPASSGGLDRAVACLYNYDFAGAHKALDEEMRARPGDPLVPALRGAAFLFAEFERQHILELQFFEGDDEVTDQKRLKPDPAVRARLLGTTAAARRLAQARLTVCPDDRNALFALCTAIGTEADYMGLVEKRYFRTYRLSKESQKYAFRLLALDPPVYDALLTIGSAEYVVGSLNAFFRFFVRFDGIKGSKHKAVTNLEVVASRGHYFRAFAKVLLAAIHLREDRPSSALKLLRELAGEFPNNPLVKKEIARAEQRIRRTAAVRR